MLMGIDISHWQGGVNFQGVKDAGNHFSITKLTEDQNYTDPTASRNRTEAKRVGMFSGIYHFARGKSAISEADHFVSVAGDITNEFTVLDWEINIPADAVQWCLTWLRRVEDRLGVKPFVYMDQSRLKGHNWSPVMLNGNPLWLAKYDGNTSIPDTGAWRTLMKQFTSSGTVPGVAGNVDRDCFYGFTQDLQKYCKGGSLPAPVPQASPWLTLPTLTYGMRNDPGVRSLQQFLHDNYSAYRHERGELAPIAGNYLDVTRGWVEEFQRRSGITGPNANGRNVGPRTKEKLWAAGWRG